MTDARFSPVAANERITTLDVIRGVALFGMGFAVMLSRAQAAGRPFLAPYVRRTLALAVFGFLHYVFVWAGDILFSYAMGAAFLLVVFHARPKVLWWIVGLAFGVAAISGGAKLAGFDLLRLPRLSVMPVSAAQWTEILRMARG